MPRPPFVSALSAVGDGGDDSDTGVGCTNSVSGCRGFVFVDEAAEQVSSSGRHC
jgi:hypothetical protein